MKKALLVAVLAAFAISSQAAPTFACGQETSARRAQNMVNGFQGMNDSWWDVDVAAGMADRGWYQGSNGNYVNFNGC